MKLSSMLYIADLLNYEMCGLKNELESVREQVRKDGEYTSETAKLEKSVSEEISQLKAIIEDFHETEW